MAEHSGRPSQYERAYRILEYLRWNTDSSHPVTQAELRRHPELGAYLGGKETSHDLIIRMVAAMNYGEHGLRPRDEWKLNFQAFDARYGGDDEGDDEDDDLDSLQIRGLHYRHTFTYEEIDRLIEALLFSSTLTARETEALIGKIESSLTTRFYQKGLKKVCKVRERRLVEPARLRENLLAIQRAIDSGRKISFLFNFYRRDKQLHPVRRERDVVSPYYVVANGGRYYLLACRDGMKNMSIWRIDLMTGIQVAGEGQDPIRREDRALDKRQVRGLPQQWDEEFHHTHLNMAFDEPVRIRLRVSPAGEGPEINYTFLHDWFGDSFRHIRSEGSAGDVVEVRCSPFAMANFAMQYGSRVEVLEPSHVREAVVDKLRAMNRKYGLDGG